ncbi:MAG: hypothetical protein HY424_02565 [Candidatus Levybacteria bacterium]|nr:hypothetical protein [Candidatus Levybacteria bacterium]
MKLFIGGFIFFVFLIFCFSFFVNSTFAATTPFRSANIVTTDGAVPFTNLNNCFVTDGLTCDRALADHYANLYFQGFGDYVDFGIPQGSIINKVRIRVIGKSKIEPFALAVGLSLQKPATSNCQWPSNLWTLWYLNGNAIATQNFITEVTLLGYPQAVKASCLQPSNFADRMTWRLNNSSATPWSANIDNFEIAFDYDPGSIPTPIFTLTPTPTPTPAPKTPLILIPGIGGSELKTVDPLVWYEDNGHGEKYFNNYQADEKVWINSFQAGLPGDDDYFDILRMKTDGQTSEVDLVLSGTLFDGYTDTINFFTSNDYALNEDFFVFPYDWRKDISLTVPLLDQKINEIKQQTGATKVDIVSHSMGGLVARNYIVDVAHAQNVRKLFTLGTPHLGAVDFLKNLRFGGCLTKQSFITDFINKITCLGVAPLEVKDIIQNMISGYELAPSQEYFNFYNNQDKNHFYPYSYNGQPLNYDQLKSFLTNLNYNTGLFNPSELFHSLDNSLAITNNVEVVNIVGSGLPTLGQIREKNVKNFFGFMTQKKDGFTINGDQTVPLFSASLNDLNKSLLGNAKVFYTKQEHGELVASGSALNLVKNILEGNDWLPNGISVLPYHFSGTRVSVHSPVNIHTYDSEGQHTGPTSSGDFEENIPGSSYDALDNAKFIWLPNDGIYNIKFEAIDKGSFDFKIRKYEDDENIQTILYKDIPLEKTTTGETEFNTTSNIPPVLRIDENGDGVTDNEISQSSNLGGEAIYDETLPTTDFQIYGTLGNSGWFKSDVEVTLIPQDESTGSGILKTEYSLDNGETVNVYDGPFIITEEKINKLKFRSVDNAGNEEDPKELEIKIDKTPPEAKIFIDQGKQDLVVVGADINPTTVTRSDNTLTKKKNDAFYVVNDEAGNYLKLDVREREKIKLDRFRIYSVQYNNDPIKILASNYFNVVYSGSKQRSNVREQNFELKGIVRIRIRYDAKENKSTIIVREMILEKVKEVRNGLMLLQLLTNKGQLTTTY